MFLMVSTGIFSVLVRKFEAGYSQLSVHGFRLMLTNKNDVFTLISAENVTRKKVSLIFLFRQSRCITSVEGRRVALESSKSPVIPFLISRVIHLQLCCSKLQIMSLGLPHMIVPTATFENNFITNGTSNDTILLTRSVNVANNFCSS